MDDDDIDEDDDEGLYKNESRIYIWFIFRVLFLRDTVAGIYLPPLIYIYSQFVVTNCRAIPVVFGRFSLFMSIYILGC